MKAGVLYKGCFGAGGSHIVQHHQLRLVGKVALDAILQSCCGMGADESQNIDPYGPQRSICVSRVGFPSSFSQEITTLHFVSKRCCR